MAFKDKLVGGGDAAERSGLVNAQYQRVTETAAPLEHGPPAAAPAQDGQAVLPAKGDVHLAGDFVGVTDHHEVPRGFPDAQQFIALPLVAQFQQGLVARQVLLRRGQGKVQIVHKAH